MCRALCVICHMLRVMCYLLRVICSVSCVMCMFYVLCVVCYVSCDLLQAKGCSACLKGRGKVAWADLSCLQIFLESGQRGLADQRADVSSSVPGFCHS